MKTIKFAVAAILVASAAMMTACGNDDKKADKEKATAEVTPASVEAIDIEAFESNINIRYIDLNRILENYTYATQESAKMQQKATELQQYQNQLAAQLQKKQNEIQQKVNSNGYFSEESYNKDVADLQKLDQSSSQQYAKRAQAFETEANKVQSAVIEAINNYIAQYNKEKKYDAILYKDAGIFFNPKLDITDEIIEGLNAAVKPAEKADKASK